MDVLVLNAGSSTLKYRLVDPASGLAALGGVVERIGGTGPGDPADHAEALHRVEDKLDAAGVAGAGLLAVGHRVVHGGARFPSPVLIDDEVEAAVDDLARLAPLHNPPALAGIQRARALFAGVPQVAAFDTSFFHGLPTAAATYAIDADLARAHEVRRYGAHGISHEYVAGAAADLLGRLLTDLDLVTLHLGNGASAAAISGGRPLDTSMGLTPLEGLVMGTRPGDLDPGAVVHLMRHAALDVDALEDVLEHRSGLRGLVGSQDLRDLGARVAAGDPAAETAHAVYCHRIRKYVGAYLAVLGGADAVVFTAGVGEHSPLVRRDSLAGLHRLGIVVDPARNEEPATGARRISTDDSPVAVLVVPTDEELAIARAAAALVE